MRDLSDYGIASIINLKNIHSISVIETLLLANIAKSKYLEPTPTQEYALDG